jgi:hypothetical protein
MLIELYPVFWLFCSLAFIVALFALIVWQL